MEIASAYDMAEKLCLLKQESGHELTEDDALNLNTLVEISRRAIFKASHEPPYYEIDAEEWASVADELKRCCDAETQRMRSPQAVVEAPEIAPDSTLSEDTVTIEIDDLSDSDLGDFSLDDQVIDFELNESSPEDEAPSELNIAADRVAAVLKDLAPINDLTDPEPETIESDADIDHDALGELEDSLLAFNQAREGAQSDVETQADSNDGDVLDLSSAYGPIFL